VKIELERPSLKAKASSKDMMFDMDEESDFNPHSPRESPSIRPLASPRPLDPLFENTPPEDIWYDSRGKILPSPKIAPQHFNSGPATPRTPKSPQISGKTPPVSGRPWTLTPLSSSKTDMRDIMAQAATPSRVSSLSQDLAAARLALPEVPASFSLPAPKLSQKDRKRMQHAQQASSSTVQPAIQPATTPLGTSPFSWQAVSAQNKSALKDVMASETTKNKAVPARTNSTPQLTMRQTVANAKGHNSPKPATGPAGQPPSRSVSESKPVPSREHASPVPRPAPQASNSRPIPQSIRHQPVVDLDFGLTMTEILEQQQLEKRLIKEAVAKRDLQEIQAEQEFQEWWEKESARVQEAEQRDLAAATSASKSSSKKGRGRGAGRSKSGKGGAAQPAGGNGNHAAAGDPVTSRTG